MEEYSFYEGELTPDYKLAFELAIFNRREHLLLQSLTGWSSFYIINKKERSIVAAIFFNTKDRVAISPFKSPFGGIDFCEDVPNPILFNFLLFVEEILHRNKVTKVILKNPPEKYNNLLPAVTTMLIDHGYNKMEDISAIIEINAPNIESSLRHSDKRRLLKSREAGLTFQKLNIDHLRDVYTFIEECRSSKGYKLSMEFRDLEKTVQTFPHDFLLFAVFYNDRIAAASISIRVKRNVLYDFYHDHHKDFNYFSPVVMLINGIAEYCYMEDIKLLDLGTSSINNSTNVSLLNFKLKLGATPSTKFTFEKTLA
ncbi:GNAT family N-acetyltransferase [Chryseosolibacter indicus]|uniref:GNAT family N-acetyltransferase n=1 Tax=Chryseosolibacter indicus TaxID=2782351 RepID=A0ABS5VP25_9BACT|nr:GNAT family N-acetyltransferase [Chryseosolibacter indicus]MBT1702773.1 GNAT family N-acetyltransferase [Chryseosolibacter indicus]